MRIFDGLTLYSTYGSATINVSGPDTVQIPTITVNTLTIGNAVSMPPNSIAANAINWGSEGLSVVAATITDATITNTSINGQATINNAEITHATITNATITTATITNIADITALSFNDDAQPIDLPSGSTCAGKSLENIIQPTLTCGFMIGRKYIENDDANVIPCGLPNGEWTLKIVDPNHLTSRTIKCTVNSHGVTWTQGASPYGHDGTETQFWDAVYCLDEFFVSSSTPTQVWILEGEHLNPEASEWDTASSQQFRVAPNTAGIYEGFIEAPLSNNKTPRTAGYVLQHNNELISVALTPRFARFLSFGDLYWWIHYACDQKNANDNPYKWLQYASQDNCEFERGTNQESHVKMIQYNLKAATTDLNNGPIHEPVSFILTFSAEEGIN